MQGQRGRNERRAGVFLDVALVFLLAALLNGINGVFELKTCGRDKKRFRMGAFQMVLCAGLGLLGVLSALSLWF